MLKLISMQNLFSSFLISFLFSFSAWAQVDEWLRNCQSSSAQTFTATISGSIWQTEFGPLFEVKGGFHFLNPDSGKLLKFQNNNESIVKLHYFDQTAPASVKESTLVLTRVYDGFSAYKLDKNGILSFLFNHKFLIEYAPDNWGSSYLVDAYFTEDLVYLLANFDLFTVDKMQFVDGDLSGALRTNLSNPLKNDPDRSFSFRLLEDSIQSMQYRRGHKNDPEVKNENLLKPNGKYPQSELVDQHYFYIFPDKSDQLSHLNFFTLSSSGASHSLYGRDENSPILGIPSYVFSAWFENSDPHKGRGFMGIYDLGVEYLINGVPQCVLDFNPNISQILPRFTAPLPPFVPIRTGSSTASGTQSASWTAPTGVELYLKNTDGNIFYYQF